MSYLDVFDIRLPTYEHAVARGDGPARCLPDNLVGDGLSGGAAPLIC